MSVLSGVDTLIEAWLGITDNADYGQHPRYSSRTAAMALSNHGGPLGETSEQNLLVELLKKIDENWNDAGRHPPSSETWELGKEEWLSPANKSHEVVLERLIVRLLNEHWTNQVPTCSGLIPGAGEGKRSIDLVHNCGGGEYEFIELKFNDGIDGRHGSNNPLDAAWEILEYGLLYAHARQNELRREAPLMKASTIHLVVLAPARWYEYAPGQAYAFKWLEDHVNRWLSDKAFSNDELKMDFQFQRFTEKFEKIYNHPQPLPAAIQAFRQADLQDRGPVYGSSQTA